MTFELHCSGSSSLIAFTSNAVQLLAILVINPDGSGLKNLTPIGDLESDPVWSPDGRRILFLRNGDLFAMESDGSGRIALADGVMITEHRWSPDGRMIAYVDVRDEGNDAFDDLWVMQADGTRKVKLAEQAFNISWSPDGRLVYTSIADFADVHLRIVKADGSGDVRLTTRAAFQPAWSPDGSRIAFVGLEDNDIYLIDPDGSNEANLTKGVSDDESPTWSPDGSRIAFTLGPLGQTVETEIAVMNPDGSGRTTLTTHPGFDFQPTWSPDGAKLVFTRAETSGDTEIYVMNADGSGQTDLTNRPDSRETTPDWNGRGADATMATGQSAFQQRWLRARH
jgi:TolB protein